MLFESSVAAKFVFLGGTCLRIVHNNQRFSEDLDFDNIDLSESEFELVSGIIQTGLQREGYQVEIRNVYRGAYHCYIRFPGLLFQSGLSEHREARILINLDTEPQHVEFEPDLFFLNRFDVFTSVRTTPLDLLLSQKILAMTGRKQAKGRDFFDIVFLMGKTKPNYALLSQRLQITTGEELKRHILSVSGGLDFQKLAVDVQPFLFNPADVRRVLAFPQLVQQVEF